LIGWFEGVVSYQYSDGEAGLRRDALFCYDIKLPKQ
jgi:hypothetical protein